MIPSEFFGGWVKEKKGLQLKMERSVSSNEEEEEILSSARQFLEDPDSNSETSHESHDDEEEIEFDEFGFLHALEELDVDIEQFFQSEISSSEESAIPNSQSSDSTPSHSSDSSPNSNLEESSNETTESSNHDTSSSSSGDDSTDSRDSSGSSGSSDLSLREQILPDDEEADDPTLILPSPSLPPSLLTVPILPTNHLFENSQRLYYLRYMICHGDDVREIKRHLQISKYLIYKFYEMDVYEFYSDAIKFQRNEIFELLLCFFRDRFPIKHRELLSLAIHYSNLRAFKLILAEKTIKINTLIQQTLWRQCLEHSLAFVKALIDHGIQLTFRDRSAVTRVVSAGKLTILKYLIEHNHIELVSHGSSQFLMDLYLCACREGRLNILRYLKNKFEKHIPYGVHCSCDLFYAVTYNHVKVVRFLMQSTKCDASAQFNRCLRKACLNNNPQIVSLLLNDSRVSGVEEHPSDLLNPLQICIRNGFHECGELLIKFQQFDETHVLECCLYDNFVLLKCIIHNSNEVDFLSNVQDAICQATRSGSAACLLAMFQLQYVEKFTEVEGMTRITLVKLYKHHNEYICQNMLRYYYRCHILKDFSLDYTTRALTIHNQHYWSPALLQGSFICPICIEPIVFDSEDLYKHCNDHQVFHMVCLYKYMLTKHEAFLATVMRNTNDWFQSLCLYPCPMCRDEMDFLDVANIFFSTEHRDDELLSLHARERAMLGPIRKRPDGSTCALSPSTSSS